MSQFSIGRADCPSSGQRVAAIDCLGLEEQEPCRAQRASGRCWCDCGLALPDGRARRKIRALYRSIAAAMLAGRQRAAYLSGGRRGRAPVLKSPARAAWLSMFYLANAITYSQFRTTSQTTEFAPGKRPVSTRCHAADMDNPGLGLPRTTSPQALTRGLASSLVNDRMARGTPACISCSKTISACAQENGAVDRPRDAGPLSPARNL